MSDYPYSKYTITFKEFLETNMEWFTSTIVMSTPQRTAKLHKALISMWDTYELSGETIGEMKLFLKDTLDLHSQYYEDMLDGYDKEFDYADGIVKEVKYDDKSINVDLPNKVVSPDDLFDYPNDARKNDANTTTTDNTLFLTMKRKYLQQIRNLYNEFAYKFKDCFIQIYSEVY